MSDARHEHRLEGCGPVPLGSYLKALGVFRLVAEQADPDATACWRDERLVLRTRLDREALVAFFTDHYRPSPILSPWNGRAGFLEGEEEDGEESSRGGAELIRTYERAADRFTALKLAAQAYKRLPVIDMLNRSRAEAKPLQTLKVKKQSLSETQNERLSTLKKLIKISKRATITELRSSAPENSLPWFDACLRIGEQGANSPSAPLLGAGGADGSRDFGMGFGLALGGGKNGLFDFATGKPSTTCEVDFRAAVLGYAAPLMRPGNVGMFEPAAVGENQTSGFRGELPLNNWEFVLLLEGAILFSGSTSRRLGSSGSTRASFPFTVDALTAGTGATSPGDDTGFAEFWTPIWGRHTSFDEMVNFLREGRSTLGRKGVATGLDFAVSVASLGAQRGVTSFGRHAILVREPLSPRKATYFGRVEATQKPTAGLVREIQPWLAQLKSIAGGGEAGNALVLTLRRAEDALFRLAYESDADGLCAATQELLVAVGGLSLDCARRPALRKGKKGLLPTPPPRLSARWRGLADDGTAEFALAAALAGMVGESPLKGAAMPFRAHLAPIEVDTRFDRWAEGTAAEARVVWGGCDLVRDLTAVLDRRLLEAQRNEFIGPGGTELPLRSRQAAPLWAVIEFLAEATDDDRIAELAAGLAWVSPPAKGDKSRARNTTRDDVPPFLYAALKPLFDPAGIEGEAERRRVKPLPLLRLLLAGNVGTAVHRAQLMARGAGLPTPFLRHALSDRAALSARASPQRLAAALAFPIWEWRMLTDRAYPDLSRDKETSDAA